MFKVNVLHMVFIKYWKEIAYLIIGSNNMINENMVVIVSIIVWEEFDILSLEPISVAKRTLFH